MAAERAAAARLAPARSRSPCRGLVITGLGVAFILGTGIAARLLDTSASDLDVFFWPSAEIAAHGHPLLVYAVRSHLNPDDNGPLALLPLTLVAALSNALGIAGTMPLRDGLTEATFAVFSLLMAREAVLAVESGQAAQRRRLAIAALFLALPPLWIATIDFGHVEAPLELWLLLLGVRLLTRGATLRAGFCLGLAVLTRSLALVVLVPLVLSLLAERRWQEVSRLLAATALVTAAGIAPFLVADRSDVIYSLVTFRSTVPVFGGSLWFAFRGAPWIGAVQANDAWIFTASAAALCAALLAIRPRRLYALLAVSSLCVPMLAKTTWPYYYLEPCVFTTIWWLARPMAVISWRALPPAALAVGGAAVAAVEQRLPLPALPGDITGIAASVGVAAVILAIFVDAARGTRGGTASIPVSPASVVRTGSSSAPRYSKRY